MSILKPFRALRPDPERAAIVAAPPYDVVDINEALSLVQRNPWSFIRISRPEVDFLSVNESPSSSSVYQRAALNFENLIHSCPYFQEVEPSLYLYRLSTQHHEQTGVVGCFSLQAYESDKGQYTIKKHERTRQEKEEDRTQHILAVSAQTGPVLLGYSDHSEIDSEVLKMTHSKTLYDFVAEDSVSHTVWKIENSSNFAINFNKYIHTLYIADGHHRAAAASRAAKITRRCDSFLGVAFPVSQLKILPYHRIVKDLAGMTKNQFLEKISKVFEVIQGLPPVPGTGEFSMYLDNIWYRLRLKKVMIENPNKLDVDLLQEKILSSILGISNPCTDERIDFVGGVVKGANGTDELEKRVRSGEAAVSFAMHPTRMSDIIRVTGVGGMMPPKSTWFEPKLRDGLFLHVF